VFGIVVTGELIAKVPVAAYWQRETTPEISLGAVYLVGVLMFSSVRLRLCAARDRARMGSGVER
jgi:hypothetical protein